MADYDYIAGKKRIKEILNNKLEVIENDKIPNNENFTFSNAHYGWVTAIFVDIRNSTNLFSKDDKEVVSKMIRAFTSEIIEILRNDDNLREIGIRGDCVYGIYTTPKRVDIYDTFLDGTKEMINHTETPGKFKIEKKEFYFYTKDGIYHPKSVQLQGKKMMAVKDFLNGFQNFENIPEA